MVNECTSTQIGYVDFNLGKCSGLDKFAPSSDYAALIKSICKLFIYQINKNYNTLLSIPFFPPTLLPFPGFLFPAPFPRVNQSNEIAEWVEHLPPISVGHGIRTLIESNQWLKYWYLSLPSLALGITRIVLPECAIRPPAPWPDIPLSHLILRLS